MRKVTKKNRLDSTKGSNDSCKLIYNTHHKRTGVSADVPVIIDFTAVINYPES